MSGLMDNEHSGDMDLDSSVDDVTSAPDFITPPNGLYDLTIVSVKPKTTEKKNKIGEMEKKSRVNVVIGVVKTIEVADGEAGVPDGSLFSNGFNWDEVGKTYLKQFCDKILGAEVVKGASWKELFNALTENVVFNARIRIKSDGQYENVNLNDIKPGPHAG